MNGGASASSDNAKASAGDSDSGRPLTADEKAAYKGDISDQALNSARIHDGDVPIWLRKDMDAVTLHDDIYIRKGAYDPDTAGGVELLGHELTHVMQYQHGMTYLSYLWASLRGYASNHFEVEAYRAGAQIRAQWCGVHIGSSGC